MDVEDLSPVAQDYLKVIYSAGEWGDPPITTSGLAARLGTTAANVSETIRRLDAQGLVSYQPYRPAALTELGRRLAIAMVRRHRLLETFLAEVLGYDWDEVHDEAERLEHAVSDDFLARVDRLLGHPRFDPHGDPIPAPDGDGSPPATELLSAVGDGSYLVVRVSDAEASRLARLARCGMRPGALVRVDGGVLVPGNGVGVPGDSASDLQPDDLAAVRVAPA